MSTNFGTLAASSAKLRTDVAILPD